MLIFRTSNAFWPGPTQRSNIPEKYRHVFWMPNVSFKRRMVFLRQHPYSFKRRWTRSDDADLHHIVPFEMHHRAQCHHVRRCRQNSLNASGSSECKRPKVMQQLAHILLSCLAPPVFVTSTDTAIMTPALLYLEATALILSLSLLVIVAIEVTTHTATSADGLSISVAGCAILIGAFRVTVLIWSIACPQRKPYTRREFALCGCYLTILWAILHVGVSIARPSPSYFVAVSLQTSDNEAPHLTGFRRSSCVTQPRHFRTW